MISSFNELLDVGHQFMDSANRTVTLLERAEQIGDIIQRRNFRSGCRIARRKRQSARGLPSHARLPHPHPEQPRAPRRQPPVQTEPESPTQTETDRPAPRRETETRPRPPPTPAPECTPARPLGYCVRELCHLPLLTHANVMSIFACVIAHLSKHQLSDYAGPLSGPAGEPRAVWSWQEMREAFPGAVPESHYEVGMIPLFTKVLRVVRGVVFAASRIVTLSYCRVTPLILVGSQSGPSVSSLSEDTGSHSGSHFVFDWHGPSSQGPD